MKIGKLIRHYRQAKGISQAELARRMAVSPSYMNLIEKGQRVGRVKDCMVAGNVFDIFHRIRAIGDTQETRGSMIAPAVCFEAVSVAGGG